MKYQPVSNVEQNLDLVTGFVENAGRTLNVSRASENELQFVIHSLVEKCLQLILQKDNIESTWCAIWRKETIFTIAFRCVVHTLLCDYKKSLFLEK